jgi:hypothetical protein
MLCVSDLFAGSSIWHRHDKSQNDPVLSRNQPIQLLLTPEVGCQAECLLCNPAPPRNARGCALILSES